jgi:hypothetical protein
VPGEFSCYFDLQIIQGLPQVKTPRRQLAPFFGVSLGFKQLPRSLCAVFLMSLIGCGFACADKPHQNKLQS